MRLLFKGEIVTRTERASQGMNRNSSLAGHTNGVGSPPNRIEEHSPAPIQEGPNSDRVTFSRRSPAKGEGLRVVLPPRLSPLLLRLWNDA